MKTCTLKYQKKWFLVCQWVSGRGWGVLVVFLWVANEQSEGEVCRGNLEFITNCRFRSYFARAVCI